MKQRQTERVKRAVEYVKKRLRLDLEFVVTPDGANGLDGLLHIERSYRGREDRKAWLVTFDPLIVADESMASLRRHAFHEALHALTWPLFDEAEAAIRRVPERGVRRELLARSLDARENVVYELERKIGPLAFPRLPWAEP